MIINAEHVNRVESGAYREVIYDIKSSWNSSEWGWIKFTDDNYEEWIGQFRGKYLGHGISQKDLCVYVLTTDYLFVIYSDNGLLKNYVERPEYRQLTVSPSGECIVATCYEIQVLDESLEEIIYVELPVQLDMISFSGWNGDILVINADEFMNWENHMRLRLNTVTWNIEKE